MHEIRPELLKYYKGDVELLKADVKWGNRYVMWWDDIVEQSEIHPQYSEEAKDEIIKYLGYKTEEAITLPHEPFIRTLIHSYKQGSLSETQFNDAVASQVMHIRNDDMKKGGWTLELPYTENELRRYDTYLPQFKEAARKRLVKFVKYEPPLEHSLHAELMIRDLMTFDYYTEDMSWTPWDYKGITILFYIRALLEHDEETADSLPLLGF